jgi:hypothetical protein
MACLGRGNASQPTKETVQRYVARKTQNGWVVAWGRFDEARTKFLIAYEAQQKDASTEYTVIKHEPPVEDSDFYLRGAKAEELATGDFLREAHPQRPYNFSILPRTGGEWYAYAIPAQTDAAILPYGGDVRYTVSADGTKILEKRQMHKTVLEENVGQHPEFGFHTHILSDVPEDSDVFYALTRGAARGEWIGTKSYFYEIRMPGSLAYLGKTPEIVKLLQDDKPQTLEEPYKSMVLASAQRLLADTYSGDPLEAYTVVAGARCTDKTLWLKVNSTIHNVSDGKIILYKDPLRNSQARFGASAEKILSGKYEKLAFFTSDKVDLSKNESFIELTPGMVYSHEQEYPMLGIDLKGKGAVQFLFFTWPLGQEKEVDTQRSRLQSTGHLYSDTIAAAPIPLKIDLELLGNCPPVK